ncbi:hypothetical protein N9383_05850 [Granulosicoccus sp.]|nr:hypothetical protein [Granulosicoccus sp.]
MQFSVARRMLFNNRNTSSVSVVEALSTLMVLVLEYVNFVNLSQGGGQFSIGSNHDVRRRFYQASIERI